MWIMVVYVLIVAVCELAVVAIGLVLDRIFPLASLPVSLLSSGLVGFYRFGGPILSAQERKTIELKSSNHARNVVGLRYVSHYFRCSVGRYLHRHFLAISCRAKAELIRSSKIRVSALWSPSRS